MRGDMLFFSVMEITLKHSSLYYKVIYLLNKAIHLLNDSTYVPDENSRQDCQKSESSNHNFLPCIHFNQRGVKLCRRVEKYVGKGLNLVAKLAFTSVTLYNRQQRVEEISYFIQCRQTCVRALQS